jgi:heme-degrading monooxygenase HmoA
VRYLIAAFEVPPDADEAFIGAWERARDRGALHRALRSDVPLRFVEVARVESMEADSAALPFPTHAALYEVVHEDGEPDGAGGVLLVEPFEVPAGADEQFLAGWARVRELFAARQGYLGTRLHRSVGPADFRFVAIVRWSSPLMFARTLQQPEVEEAIAAAPFPGHPALYLLSRSRELPPG